MPEAALRTLWHSNSPHCSTGYGVQTALVVPRLQGLGHELAISAQWGVQGGVIGWPGPRGMIPCFPRAENVHGIDIVSQHAQHHQADIVITHYDAWMFDQQIFPCPWVPWFPVDTEEIAKPVLDRVKTAGARLVQTKAGLASLERQGSDGIYIPAAFDPEIYYPDSSDGSKVVRDSFGITSDTFLVGMVAANKGGQPNRKAFPQAFDGFARFYQKHPDSLLYVHSKAQSREGLDLLELADHYGITNAIRFANPYGLLLGLDPAQMRQLYNAFDVLLAPSMGEGFGVPIVEAQACGTPVITGDWTAMSEVTRTGKAIPKTSAYAYHYPSYGEWFLVDPQAVADALEEALDWEHDPADVAERVSEYEIDRVMAEHWAPALERVAALIQPPAAGPNRAERRRMRFKDKAAA